jgi:hypothetical protein
MYIHIRMVVVHNLNNPLQPLITLGQRKNDYELTSKLTTLPDRSHVPLGKKLVSCMYMYAYIPTEVQVLSLHIARHESRSSGKEACELYVHVRTCTHKSTSFELAYRSVTLPDRRHVP